jgi:hypothetical protein
MRHEYNDLQKMDWLGPCRVVSGSQHEFLSEGEVYSAETKARRPGGTSQRCMGKAPEPTAYLTAHGVVVCRAVFAAALKKCRSGARKSGSIRIVPVNQSDKFDVRRSEVFLQGSPKSPSPNLRFNVSYAGARGRHGTTSVSVPALRCYSVPRQAQPVPRRRAQPQPMTPLVAF